MHKLFNAGAALLLGLLVAFASGGRDAAAVVVDSEEPNEQAAILWNVFIAQLSLRANLFEGDARAAAKELQIANEEVRITRAFVNALDGLTGGDRKEFGFHLEKLRQLSSHARYSKNRKLARGYLLTLPIRFVPGVAYIGEDGTLVRDPDRSIRTQLRRDEGFSLDGGGDGNGDSAD